MKKKVSAIIDNAERCPHFGYTKFGIMEQILKSKKIAHRPMCYSPAVSKPNYIRPCNCKFDKATNKFVITEGCPLESVIDEDTIKEVLAVLKAREAAESKQENESQTKYLESIKPDVNK